MDLATGLKRLVRVGVLVCVGVLLCHTTACKTNHFSKIGSPAKVEVFASVEADLAIGKPVEATKEIKEFLWIFKLGMPTDYADGVTFLSGGKIAPFTGLLGPGIEYLAIAAAAHDALKQGDYDVLLGARYHVHVEDNVVMRSVKATVSGIGAKVRGYQQVR
ncbi:hypothetical protein ACFL59_03220 [Planctomycetota bacterium]